MFPPLRLQTPAASSLFRLFSSTSLRFVCLPGMWDSQSSKAQPSLVLVPELSKTKNSSLYFESGNNVISLPARITPRCLKQFRSNYLPTRLWAETKLGKFGPQRTIFRRSREQVEAQQSDEAPLTIVVRPLCISVLIPLCPPGDASLFCRLSNVSSSSFPSPCPPVLWDEGKALNL